MSAYELVLVFAPTIAKDKLEGVIGQVRKQVEKAEGKFGAVEQWGKRPLAYPIGKNAEGVHSLLQFTVPASAVSGLEKEIRLQELVLRHLLVKREE